MFNFFKIQLDFDRMCKNTQKQITIKAFYHKKRVYFTLKILDNKEF